MKTILDEGHTWFLDYSIKAKDLKITLIEGKKGKQEVINISGKEIGQGTRVEINKDNKKVLITFKETVSYQIIDESFTSFDKYEIQENEGNYLKILSRSRYLDYINTNHGLYIHLQGPAKHYRIWTCDDVIDVIAYEEPEIKLLEPNLAS
jgi:hypothetical protein